MTADLNRLEHLAKAAIGAGSHFAQERADAMFHSVANPKTILSLIQRIRELEFAVNGELSEQDTEKLYKGLMEGEIHSK